VAEGVGASSMFSADDMPGRTVMGKYEESMMDGKNRVDIKAGSHVLVVKKQDQRSGKLRETDRRKRKEYPYKISYPSPRDQGTPGKRRSGSGKKDPFRKLLTKKKGYRNLIFLSL
jgi:hypothetical protein